MSIESNTNYESQTTDNAEQVFLPESTETKKRTDAEKAKAEADEREKAEAEADEREKAEAEADAKAQAERDLEQVLKNEPSSTELGKTVDQFTKQILESPSLQDPEKSENIVDKITDSIKSGDRTTAITTALDFLGQVFGGSGEDNDFFRFRSNTEITDFINNIKTKNYSLAEMQSQKNVLVNTIHSTSGIKKKIGMTYGLSALLDQIVYAQDPSTSWMKGDSNGSGGKSSNECAVARLAQQVQPGDIIAINKSTQKTADKLLTELTTGDIDASHVVIVTKVDKKNGTVTIAHSTMNKLSAPGSSGVEIDISLSDYTKQFGGVALVALEPPAEVNKDELVKSVMEKNNAPYDSIAAISEGVMKRNIVSNNGKYNCVELIAESFGSNVNQKQKEQSHPAQMITSLQPKYVSVAGTNIGRS